MLKKFSQKAMLGVAQAFEASLGLAPGRVRLVCASDGDDGRETFRHTHVEKEVFDKANTPKEMRFTRALEMLYSQRRTNKLNNNINKGSKKNEEEDEEELEAVNA